MTGGVESPGLLAAPRQPSDDQTAAEPVGMGAGRHPGQRHEGVPVESGKRKRRFTACAGENRTAPSDRGFARFTPGNRGAAPAPGVGDSFAAASHAAFPSIPFPAPGRAPAWLAGNRTALGGFGVCNRCMDRRLPRQRIFRNEKLHGLKAFDLVADSRRRLELEIFGGLKHLLAQGLQVRFRLRRSAVFPRWR